MKTCSQSLFQSILLPYEQRNSPWLAFSGILVKTMR